MSVLTDSITLHVQLYRLGLTLKCCCTFDAWGQAIPILFPVYSDKNSVLYFAIMLFFQLLKVLNSNIIVKYLKVANVIPVRNCTFIYDPQRESCAGARSSQLASQKITSCWYGIQGFTWFPAATEYIWSRISCLPIGCLWTYIGKYVAHGTAICRNPHNLSKCCAHKTIVSHSIFMKV
jgi:hypothetical protein